jgi:hypothetical protein
MQVRIYPSSGILQFYLLLFRALGQGAFGEVYKGYILGCANMEREIPVAIKVCSHPDLI